jgi:hypothetical protein
VTGNLLFPVPFCRNNQSFQAALFSISASGSFVALFSILVLRRGLFYPEKLFCMVILICVQINLFIPLSVPIVRSVRDRLDCGLVLDFRQGVMPELLYPASTILDLNFRVFYLKRSVLKNSPDPLCLQRSGWVNIPDPLRFSWLMVFSAWWTGCPFRLLEAKKMNPRLS